MKKLLIAAALACALWPKFAPAQNAITQTGPVLQNSPMMFGGDHKARQGATVEGATTGKIVTTGDAVVGGRCDYSAPIDDPSGYKFVCMDAKNGEIRVGGSNSASGFTFTVDGTRYTWPQQSAIVGSDAVVGNNAALKLAVGALGKRMTRMGFTTVGDGGSAAYNWSNVNCTAADDGAQVQPTGVTGCWIADLAHLKPTPMIWGAKGDGTTNDTVAVQAAIDAMANNTLYLGKNRYCIGTPGLQVTRPTNIIGQTPTYSGEPIQYGFTACSKEIPIITFGIGGGFGALASRLQDVYIDASTAGPNTTTNSRGVYLYNTSWVTIDHVRINQACIGVDEAIGNSNSVTNSTITTAGVAMASGCIGIRVGHQSTNAQDTDFHLFKTTVDGFYDASMWVEDGGGVFISDSDFLFGKNGLVISPNAGQFVLWMFANNTALSDTTCNSGLVINSGSSTGTVEGLSFTNNWTSSAGQGPNGTGCGGNGVFLENTGGGTVKSIEFTAHRSVNNTQHGVLINAGVSGVRFNGGQICQNSIETATVPGNIYNGITVASGVSDLAIHSARISGDCYNSGAAGTYQGVGIFLLGSNNNLSITGNDLTGNSNAPMNFTGTAPGGDSVIKDNTKNEAFVVNVADAATIALGLQPLSVITGTGTSITTINNMWNMREAYLYMRDGSVTLATGGNLCSGGVFPINTTAILRKIPGVNCVSVK